MISKEMFVSVITLIQTQDQLNESVGTALKLICDGDIKFGSRDNYHKALMLLLRNIFDDRENLIEWWLYISVDRVMPTEESGFDNIIDTPEQLYDLLISQKAYQDSEESK